MSCWLVTTLLYYITTFKSVGSFALKESCVRIHTRTYRQKSVNFYDC